MKLKKNILIILNIIIFSIVIFELIYYSKLFKTKKDQFYYNNNQFETGKVFDGLRDMQISKLGNFYIRDTKKIYKYDSTFNLIKSINRIVKPLKYNFYEKLASNYFCIGKGYYTENNKNIQDEECMFLLDNINGKIIMLNSNLEKKIEFGMDKTGKSYFKLNAYMNKKNKIRENHPFIYNLSGIIIYGNYIYVTDTNARNTKVFDILKKYQLIKLIEVGRL